MALRDRARSAWPARQGDAAGAAVNGRRHWDDQGARLFARRTGGARGQREPRRKRGEDGRTSSVNVEFTTVEVRIQGIRTASD
jgi:hypothetical protein